MDTSVKTQFIYVDNQQDCHYIDTSGDIDQILDYMKVLGTCLEYYKNQQNAKCNTCKTEYVASSNIMGIQLFCKCRNSTKIGYEDVILNTEIKAVMIYYLVGTIEQTNNTFQGKFCINQQIYPLQFKIPYKQNKKHKQAFSEELSVRIQQYIHYSYGLNSQDVIYVALILKDDSLVFLDKLICQQNGILLIRYDNDNIDDPQYKNITSLFFQSKISIEY